MKLDAVRAVSAGFSMLILFLFLSVTMTAASESGFQVESGNLIIYRDGLVHLTQMLVVNETFPSITLPLLSSSVGNVIVLDENQTVLDYEIDGLNLTIFSLGVKSVNVEYDTVSLTDKEAGVWTLILNNTYDLSVHLPEESTIVYLSEMPASIETVEGRVALYLPPNDWEISYVLPIVGPAIFRVTDLNVDPAEVEVGKDVTISVLVSNIGAAEGSYTVVLRVNQVMVESVTVTLAAGTSTRVEFKMAKDEAGTYTVEIGGLDGEFTAEEPPLIQAPMTYLALIGAAIIVVVYFGFVKRRKISAEKIINELPQLRQEDRDVIRFLDETGGKAFESEIRERFPDMPRTSLWRLIRRLEKMEIVTVKKIGLQNLVELNN